MKLMDVMTSPWAITPDMLREIRGIYETHMRGEKIDIAGVEARMGRPLNNEAEDMVVVKGVAIIAAEGAIAKRMNMFTRISGGVSTEILGEQIQRAVNDDSISGIILDIDSPGGTVDGTFELADKIYEMRGAKPIVALANGLMASAAYAIGAATDRIYMTGMTTHVGSVGVVSTHVDYSGYEKDQGVKTTEIYAGKYKRIASQYEPLSAEGRANIQDAVDYLYSVFVERVAKFRGVAVSTVLDDMADGRLFIGQQAIDAGLVDGVSSLDALINSLSQGRLPEPGQSTGDVQTLKTDHQAIVGTVEKFTELPVEQTETLTLEVSEMEITQGYIAEHHPDIAEAFRYEGAAQAGAEAATAERERIQSVMAQSMPGHEALVKTLAFDGKTTGPEAAVQVLNAERQAGANTLNAHKQDAPAPVEDAADTDTAAQASLPLEERCQVKWDASESLQAEFGGSFKSYLAYEKAQSAGRVKIAGKKKAA